MNDEQLRDALTKAFRQAIETVGLDAFKKISWFASNQKGPSTYLNGLPEQTEWQKKTGEKCS